MQIIISNTVTYNGGDLAILVAIVKIVKQAFGENIEIIAYDSNGDKALKYYPEIKYRKLLYLNNFKKSTSKSSLISKNFYNVKNAVTKKRFMLAAKCHCNGWSKITSLLLSKEQKEDLDNYASADLIISSGGTYLVENYNLNSRFFDYYITLALKKPLIFFTQSLGPFNKLQNKYEIKKIFDQASLILLRDDASLNHLKAIDVDVSKARVCADVVFAEADPKTLENAKMRHGGNKSLKVAISVRDWNFFKDQSVKEGMDKYNMSIAALCEYIAVTLGGEIVFISTCQGINEYWKDDSKVAQKIYELLSDAAKKRTIVDSEYHHPTQLKAIIKDFDVAVSTRMHFAIESLIMGVPVLPIAYEFKTKELFSKLITNEYILDIETIEAAKLIEAFKKFITDLPNFRTELFEKVERERQSALKPIQYLKEELKKDFNNN